VLLYVVFPPIYTLSCKSRFVHSLVTDETEAQAGKLATIQQLIIKIIIIHFYYTCTGPRARH
jgi:hypothetical protein